MILTSSKPKKQRKQHYTRPLHLKEKEFSMHLNKALRKALGKRSLEGRKGDTVRIMRGDEKFVGKQGKITAVKRSKIQVFVENVTRKKMNGTEIQVPFKPSNLELVALEEKDNRRLKGKKIATTAAEKKDDKKVKKNGE
ncbi:MAG: 50S ribosomal protein L24 [archaeon]|nr:50S ribosomal protein L24 [archaeon]